MRPIARQAPLWLLLLCTPLGAQTWQFEKNPDPLSQGHIAMANAELQSVTPMVRCWTEQASLDVRFALHHGAARLGSDQVTVRFDGQAPQTVQWSRNATRQALVVPAAAQRPLLQQLRAAKALRLRLSLEDGAQRELNIPLDGSAAAIDKATSACRR